MSRAKLLKEALKSTSEAGKKLDALYPSSCAPIAVFVSVFHLFKRSRVIIRLLDRSNHMSRVPIAFATSFPVCVLLHLFVSPLTSFLLFLSTNVPSGSINIPMNPTMTSRRTLATSIASWTRSAPPSSSKGMFLSAATSACALPL